MDFIKVNGEITPLRDVVRIRRNRRRVQIKYADDSLSEVICKNIAVANRIIDEITHTIALSNRIIDVDDISDAVMIKDGENSIFAE